MRVLLTPYWSVIPLSLLFIGLNTTGSDLNGSGSFFNPWFSNNVFLQTDTRPIEGALASITQEELEQNLKYLASDELEGRESGFPGDDLAAIFIEKKFEQYGIVPAYSHGYRQKFNISAGRGHTWNVVGYIPGSDPKMKDDVVVIGAHYDHIGKNNGKVYYGADDNGSGTVSIIEIAEACSEIRPQLRRTVVLIGFSAEERGLIGSAYYVNNPLFPLKKTIYMINLDMVGYMKSYGKLKFLGGSTNSFMQSLIQAVTARYPEVTPSLSSTSGGGSDHASFISKGVPAVFLHTGLHSNYHKPTDTPDKIDYLGLELTTKIAFELLWNLSFKEGKPAPQRSLPTLDPSWTLDHGATPYMRDDQ